MTGVNTINNQQNSYEPFEDLSPDITSGNTTKTGVTSNDF